MLKLTQQRTILQLGNKYQKMYIETLILIFFEKILKKVLTIQNLIAII